VRDAALGALGALSRYLEKHRKALPNKLSYAITGFPLAFETEEDIKKPEAPRPSGKPTLDKPEGGGGGGGGGGRPPYQPDTAAEAAERAFLANEKAVDDLAKQIVMFDDARAQFIDQALGRLNESATDEQWGMAEELANKLYDLKEAKEQATEAERERQKVEDEGKRIFEQTRTPAEQYAATLQRLSELQSQGAVDADTYYRAISEAGDTFTKSLKKTDESAVKLSDTFQGFGQVATSAFEDAIIKGEKLETVLNGLAEDIQRLLIRNTMNKLFDIGIKAGTSALSGLFSSSWSPDASFVDPSTGRTMPTMARGGVLEHGNVIPFARGGIVQRPTIFPMARGMGLMGEAGPEAVMPLKRLPSGNLGVEGGGIVNNVQVINNHPGARVTSEEQKNDRGGMNLTVMIDALESAMAQRASRPGTALNRALAQAASPVKAR
jgi:phage-related minor tail protein